MNEQMKAIIVRNFRSFAFLASVIVFSIGLVVLAGGWGLGIASLRTIRPSLGTMEAVTAASFMLSGISLWFLCYVPVHPVNRRIAQVAATVVFLAGLITLAEYAFGRNLGIDLLLFPESSRATRDLIPGRMGLYTALNFSILGLGLFLFDLKTQNGRWPGQIFSLIAGQVALVSLVGYFYHVGSLHEIGRYSFMSIQTTVVFLVLCCGMLLARPDRGMVGYLGQGSPGSVLVRRLLPAAIGVPLAAGWLRVLGEDAGWYETELGTAGVMVLTGSVLIILVWKSAVAQDRSVLALRRAEEARDRYYQLSPDLFCIAGFDGYFKELNPAWETTLGWTVAELCARPYIEFVHTEDRAPTVTEAGNLSGGGQTLSFENRYRCKDGSYKWLQWNAIPDSDRGLIYAAARDMTASHLAEEQIRQGEGFLKSIIEHIPNMIFVKEAKELRFVRFNKAGEELLGHSREDLMGRNDYDLFPKDQADFFTRKDHLVLKEGKLLDIPEESIQTKQHGTRILHTKKIPIRDGDGKPVYLLGISEDITERKRAEDAIKTLNANLELANKELEAFSYSVSHDLRAPLRHIDGFGRILLEEYGDKLDRDGQAHIQRVRRATQKMGHLIDDILNLSRVSRAEMSREEVDMSGMAEEIAESLRRQEPERESEFRIEKGMTAEGDPRLLRVAMDNLMGNAWKYTGKKERARIEFGQTDYAGRTAFFIRDNGAGFNMAYSNKLFRAFQRLHSEKDFSGTGVGLATVQRVVHRHGGRIWAEGKEGEGAIFYFTF